VQLGLQEEQKVSDALKQRYAAAVAEQRRCYTLLKAFQASSLINMLQLVLILLATSNGYDRLKKPLFFFFSFLVVIWKELLKK
jgi:hypothetical protein